MFWLVIHQFFICICKTTSAYLGRKQYNTFQIDESNKYRSKDSDECHQVIVSYSLN